jgi:hypothetical protein
LALDVLHGEEVTHLGLIRIVGHHDVRMSKTGDGLHLALEALHERLVFGEAARKHLEGHDPFHAAVAGLEDRAHAPRAQPIEDVVIADPQLRRAAFGGRFGLVGGQYSRRHKRLRDREPAGLGVGGRLRCSLKILGRQEFADSQTIQKFLGSEAFANFGRFHKQSDVSSKWPGRSALADSEHACPRKMARESPKPGKVSARSPLIQASSPSWPKQCGSFDLSSLERRNRELGRNVGWRNARQ